MLEIIAIIFLSRNIGSMAFEKGHSAGMYKFLTVLFWIVFELIGAVIGTIVLGEGIGVYVFALLAAGLGYLIIYLIVSNLKVIENFQIEKYILNDQTLPVYQKTLDDSKIIHEYKMGEIIPINTKTDFGRYHQVQISPELKGYILKKSNLTKQ